MCSQEHIMIRVVPSKLACTLFSLSGVLIVHDMNIL